MNSSEERNEIATAIVPIVESEKKDIPVVQKKKQVNPATLPPLIESVDISTIKLSMLSTLETDKARTEYEEFINSLDINEYPDRFDQVTFGDMLHVTPSLPTNKRKLDSLLTLDTQLASVYKNARETYESLLKKTENAKLAHFAKRKKLLQKTKTATSSKEITSAVEK